MKKSLSLLLTIALVFGMFANMASAATANEAGSALQKLGVIKGDQNGGLMLDSTWKRQDLAVLLSRLVGKEDASKATDKSHTFKDVPKSALYDAVLSWAKEEGYMQGHSATKFGWNEELTNKQFAAVVLRALGVDTTSAEQYAKVGELAVAAGIFPEGTNFDAPAKRGDTYVAIVAALDTEVAGTGKKLGEILGLEGYANAELAVAKAAQSGATKITVDFNRVLTATEITDLTVAVKNGLVSYPVTAKASEDKKSVVLEATFLPAQEYDVVVNKLDAVKVKVEAAKVSKIDIGAASIQKAAAQDLLVKAFNQFNEEDKTAAVAISAFSSKNGDLVAKLAGGKLDASLEDVDNTIVITASNYVTGLTATKTFKVVAKSSPTTIALGQVAPLKDADRVYTGKAGYALPYTLNDQYGGTIKLAQQGAVGGAAATSVVFGDISFTVSNSAIVSASTFAVDADGVLTFATGATAGNVVITAVNTKTGANASVSVNVEAAASLKTFQLSAPAAIVVKGEGVAFPYVAADSQGKQYANKDVVAAAGGLTFTANNAAITPKFKANGDIEFTFANTGTTTVMAWLNNQIVSTVVVDVKDVAYAVSVAGTKDLKTTLTTGATQTVDFSKLIVRDNYGRTMSAANGWAVAITTPDAAGKVSVAGSTVTGTATGSEKVKVTLSKATFTNVTFDISFTVIANADVKSLTVGTVGTVYAKNAPGTGHSVTLTLTGKTEAGVEVALNAANFYDLVTTSDASVVAKEAGLTIYGKAKGTAVVAVWKDGVKLNEQTVTVSDVAPFATSVKFKKAEYTLSGNVGDNLDLNAEVEVKDQYGVAITDAGSFYSSKGTIADVADTSDRTDGDFLKATNGIITVTYVTVNGLSATTTLNVESL
ncbi:MAG: hypothetical protein P0Y55_15410 [Candidatus Cohnella colombiensis]|uniref:SLH domain-containing protein n=1 Tax=Candidatus Cohnella colombiensis TaxID=3121368 RepID=A0AA95JA38_9BACL|nr:MAG: hypothetical protein P0Y55_15410 [Cohnella sp.]